MSQLAVSPESAYQRMLKSNLQPEEKNVIKQWAKDVLGLTSDMRIHDAPGGLLSAFRQGSEGLALAAGLAYVHVNVKNGLDVRGVPLDGASGAALLLASAFMGHSELGTDARNLGQDALMICAFRKMVDAFALQRVQAGRALYDHLQPGKGGGWPANDRVAAAAANL